MPLHPQAALAIQRAGDLPTNLSPAQLRVAYETQRLTLLPEKPAMAVTFQLSIPSDYGPIPARFYRATKGKGPCPLLVYFHGGGFMLGSLALYDTTCRRLAANGDCAVLSVDYRMAPETQFPGAVLDAYAATRWASDNAQMLNIDPGKIAVGGDSAGGNLAAVVAILLRDAGGPQLVFQALAYPATDQRMDSASHAKFSDGYLLTRKNLLWFRGNYLDPRDYEDWRASPLLAADLARLPPAHIITAGYDPLLDEGRAYSDRMVASGVPVLYECFEGMAHGFLTMGGALAAANHALYRLGQSLAQAFRPEKRG